MTNPNLHSLMLTIELGFIAAQTSVMGLQRADCGDSLLVWGATIDGQKIDLVVMQDNLNARRCIDDVLRPHAITQYFYITRVPVSLTNTYYWHKVKHSLKF